MNVPQSHVKLKIEWQRGSVPLNGFADQDSQIGAKARAYISVGLKRLMH